MKRKREEISDLRIYKPHFLRCEVCNTPVYKYELCYGNFIYCGYDCYAIIKLSQKDDFLDSDNSLPQH